MKTIIIILQITFLPIVIFSLIKPPHVIAQGPQIPQDMINAEERNAREQKQAPASSYLDDFNSAITGLTYGLDTTPGDIISDLLPIFFTLSGLVLFGMLIMGGSFQMMTSAGNPKGADAGKAKLTSALIGFLLIFMAYWLTQFMQIVFGVKIL